MWHLRLNMLIVLLSGLMVALGQDNAPEVTQKESAPTFSSRVNLVLVPVVVRDAQGRVIGNLTKDDFQLFDKGKLQAIASFQVLKHLAQVKPANNLPIVVGPGSAAVPLESPERYVAYLFDDLNATFGDLAQVKIAATKHIANSLQAGDRAAIYSTSGQTMLEFTDDKAKLAETIAKLQVRPIYQHAGRQCPDVSYYMADLITNKRDPNALNAASLETIVCMGMDPTQSGVMQQAQQMAEAASQQELSVGEQSTRVTLSLIKSVVRRMGSKPGQRLVVLASPGFLTLTGEARDDETQIMDLAASLGVILSSLNSRGLFTTNMDASQQGAYSLQNQQLIEQYYRESAEVTEDVLAELADGTGGLFFHNSNDLGAGFARIATVPDISYVLGFSPLALKPDGSYHRLKISVNTRKDSAIQARRGYYALKHGGNADADAKADIESAVFSRDELSDIPVNLQTQYFKSGLDSAKLTVVAKVDLRKLKFIKLDGRSRDDLTVVVALFDRNGNYLKSASKSVVMRLRDDTLTQLAAGISVKNSFDVAPGAYVVRLVVRDSEGQAMAAQNGAVEIP